MKKFIYLLLIASVLSLSACCGSDAGSGCCGASYEYAYTTGCCSSGGW